MKLDKKQQTCKTCEWNFRGTCANEYYGEKIKDIDKSFLPPKKSCGSWSISFKYYSRRE